MSLGVLDKKIKHRQSQLVSLKLDHSTSLVSLKSNYTMETSLTYKTSKANTTFALDLFKKLSEADKTANIFYSPFSISSALAMVMLGTKGNTSTQMLEVLGFTERKQPKHAGAEMTQSQMQMQNQCSSRLPQCQREMCMPPQRGEDDVHASLSKLMNKLIKDDTPYALSLANRLYGEQSYQFVKHYLAETQNLYNAELESVDFKASAEAARVNINGWVEEQTQGKIKDLLAKGVVSSMTRLVLVNAIYFKGNWDKQFKEDSTVDAPFRMNKVLEMPYQGKDLSMLIFLPNEIEDDSTGLEKLEKELTYEKFVEWTRGNMMGETKVEVKLPRFKMEESYDLKEILKSMGIVDAFDVTMSDFSGMSKANDLFLSQVVHKAFVEVNEEGTEAAAATAGLIAVTSVQITAQFNADHPFLFFIRHNPTMSILFAGRYCSPE
ncbi:leukocyte elastase inhibitor-like isoform X2 [Eleginops maclovinus]|uniref:leukocyte elastase inhibitor-like isoform X2 n=1 Tax=Eleginops maclovinus TaxID=56733 RepID=UPI0030803FDC